MQNDDSTNVRSRKLFAFALSTFIRMWHGFFKKQVWIYFNVGLGQANARGADKWISLAAIALRTISAEWCQQISCQECAARDLSRKASSQCGVFFLPSESSCFVASWLFDGFATCFYSLSMLSWNPNQVFAAACRPCWLPAFDQKNPWWCSTLSCWNTSSQGRSWAVEWAGAVW